MSGPSRELLLRRDKVKDARIAELEASADTSICIFCGATMEKDLTVMLDHAKGCEKRPENNLLKRAEQAEAALAERDEELKHLRSRWDWTEYWFDNLYPSDWQRCQVKYDATKTGARPIADLRTRAEEGSGA